MSVFHVYSHINLHGNDRADDLANEGRASSPLYSYLLPSSDPTKRRCIDVLDVAEVHVVMSSDEQRDVLYLSAKRDYQLSGATNYNSPRPHGFSTPPPSSPSDFGCDTPEPPDSQDFFLGGGHAKLARHPPLWPLG